jgi:hypothetical protein
MHWQLPNSIRAAAACCPIASWLHAATRGRISQHSKQQAHRDQYVTVSSATLYGSKAKLALSVPGVGPVDSAIGSATV